MVTAGNGPKTLCTISHKPMKGISPNFVTDVFGFVGVLISIWDQRSKVKITAGDDPKNRMNTISSQIFSPKLDPVDGSPSSSI